VQNGRETRIVVRRKLADAPGPLGCVIDVRIGTTHEPEDRRRMPLHAERSEVFAGGRGPRFADPIRREIRFERLDDAARGVGIVADDVDPADYDSFSLSPLEELYWRTEWKEVGFFTIAMFFVKEVESNVVISTLPDSNLYLWKRDDSSQPVVCRMTLEQILDGVEQNPTKIDEFLIHVTKGTRMPDPE